MNIAMLYPNNLSFGPYDHEKKGIGGSESSLLKTFEHLVKLGNTVHVFNKWDERIIRQNWSWQNLVYFNPSQPYDVVYSLRHADMFDMPVNAGVKAVFLADTESVGLGDRVRQDKVNLVMAVSKWQKEKIAKEENIPDDKWLITSAGVEEMEGGWLSAPSKVKGRCVFMGTPDKGLGHLLRLWPRIREAVPFATLHVYSSYIGWNLTLEENERHLISEYSILNNMKDLGVVNYKHGTASEIRRAQLEAEVYLYPTDFHETCCMCVLEAMYCGCLPVTTRLAALAEKVIDGVTGYAVPALGASTDAYASAFVSQAVAALQADDNQKNNLQGNAYTYARQYVYADLVRSWADEWHKRAKL